MSTLSARLPLPFKGILFALISFTLWVLADAFIKRITEAAIPTFEIIALSSPMIALVMFVRTRLQHTSTTTTLRALWPKNWRKQWLLSIFGFGSMYFCVVGLKHLPLSIFYVSVFTAPMMIAVLATLFLNEKPSFLKALAILAGFTGVVFAVDPSLALLKADWVGYGAAFLCAFFYAVAVILARFLTRSEAPESITFFNAINQTILSALLLLFTGGWQNLTGLLLLLLLVTGLFNAGGNFLSYRAVKYAPAATVASYHYTQIVSGTLLAVLIWHEKLSMPFLLGTAIIIASGLYVAHETHQTATS